MRRLKDRTATVVVTACFVIAVVPLVWLVWTVLSKGLSLVLQSSWWTNSQNGITVRQEGGGAYHAIIGTIEQVLVCALIAVPIGIMVGIYLVEYGRGRLSRITTFMVDILTGIPSIVAALFIYALVITTLDFNRMGLGVSLALVLLMIPVIVRTTEEMLKLVPNELREASYALGIPKWKTVMRIVIPTAFTGIVTGIMLGVARVMGETAPLLILVGYSKAINFNLLSGPQASLPGMINDERANIALPFAAERAWAASLTLIFFIMILNLLARVVAWIGSAKK
jgi:phosphate transport system permease protein